VAKLGGRPKGTVYFIGDSLSQQFWNVFACRLYAMGHDFKAFKPPMAPYASSCVGSKIVHLCYISAGTAHGRDNHVFETVRRLSKTLKRGDILIVNEGVWWRGQRGDVEEKIIQSINPSLVSSLLAKGMHLVWFETLPQHFNTSHGTFGSWYDSKVTSCGPIRDVTFIVQRNKKVSQILQAKGIPVAKTFEMTLPAYKSHLERKTKHVAEGADCTHFCTPSSTLENAMDAISALLLKLLSKKR